ncbi:general substrate transporter [Trichoderma pleuroticola]
METTKAGATKLDLSNSDCPKSEIAEDVHHHEGDSINTHKHQQSRTEEKISIQEAAKSNPVALAWCCYMLFTCIMYGYDGLAGSIVLSINRFRQDYGYLYQGQYVVSAAWQLGFTAGSMAGIVLGGLLAGLAAKRIGQMGCIAASYLLSTAGVFLQWFSVGSLPMFFGGKLLTGIPLGVFLTVAPVYCSEVAPPALRGPFVAAVNWGQVMGQLLAYGVLQQTQSLQTSRSYQIIFAVQWGFNAVGLTLVCFCPESPMRLLARGKEAAARKSIERLYPRVDVDEKVVEIRAILDHERDLSKESGTFKTCFDRKNRLRTLIALSVFFFQANSGLAWVVGYMGYFLLLSGMADSIVFKVTLGIVGFMAVGNMVGWVMIEKFGRRTTIFSGMVFCTVSLLIIGVLGLFINRSNSYIYAQAAFMALWAFSYQGSMGAAGYTLVAEVPTSSLREPTQSMATMTNGISNSVWSFALPYMINPDQANMGGKIAFIFFGLCLVADVFIYFYYPETKGRSFEEIDDLFERNIPPRHFSKTT